MGEAVAYSDIDIERLVMGQTKTEGNNAGRIPLCYKLDDETIVPLKIEFPVCKVINMPSKFEKLMSRGVMLQWGERSDVLNSLSEMGVTYDFDKFWDLMQKVSDVISDHLATTQPKGKGKVKGKIPAPVSYAGIVDAYRQSTTEGEGGFKYSTFATFFNSSSKYGGTPLETTKGTIYYIDSKVLNNSALWGIPQGKISVSVSIMGVHLNTTITSFYLLSKAPLSSRGKFSIKLSKAKELEEKFPEVSLEREIDGEVSDEEAVNPFKQNDEENTVVKKGVEGESESEEEGSTDNNETSTIVNDSYIMGKKLLGKNNF